MQYRNKTYVAFDADNDMWAYRLMQAWKDNDNFDFNFYNAHDVNTIRATSGEDAIKAALRERMRQSKILVVLIGEKTKNCHVYVKWEIELALKHGLPIIAVNLNTDKGYDKELAPAALRDRLAIHIPFGAKIMTYALDNWPARHTQLSRDEDTSPCWYKDSVYQDLGI